jgi:signal transduction histidine kinase
MFPGVVSMALVPSRRPWWAVGYLAICTPLVLVVSALGRSDRYPHLPALGDVAWAVVFSASFVLAGIAAVRTGDLLDAAREEAARIAAEAAAQEARESERELHKLLVHDRVLVVLQEVAAGVNTHLVPHARKALTDMEIADPDVDSPATDLVSRLRRVVREMDSKLPVVVVDSTVAPRAVPDEVADALVGAAGEAIRNALRHAGTGAAIRISVDWREETVHVAVADTGEGFDLQAVAPDRMGVRMSITRRMAAVGGLATIETAPARGTRVLLQWPR